MSGYDEVDHYIRDYEREQFELAEWLEARDLERADTLAERGGQHRPVGDRDARPTSNKTRKRSRKGRKASRKRKAPSRAG